MDYSQATKELIDRQCRNVEREDFDLNKSQAEELILKTYDLFNLPRPKKVKWVIDIFDETFARSAWSAWSSVSARSAGSAGSAWSAWSAGSARSTEWTALDYDFDWFVVEHEYCINRKDNPGEEPNENDKKYLEYCELLMQAKEQGLGYRVEWENTLYLAPTPLVKIDTQNRFHSERTPSIRWKDGKEFYYLNGVNFEHDLWKKVISGMMTFSEILKIENTEQRLIAMKYNPLALMNENPKLINKTKRGNELWLITDSEVNKIYDEKEVYLLGFIDPSKKAPNNKFYEEVEPALAKNAKNADEINAVHCGLDYEMYKKLKIET